MHTHLAGNMAQHHVAAFKLDAKCRVREVLKNLAFHRNDFVLGHFLLPHRQTRALEVRLLEQRVVLVRHHVGLDLRHEIHRHHHNNQQRRTTEVEGNVPAHHQEFRQQAHQRDVDGTCERQTHQDLVDVARRLFARTDARNKRTTLLQVVRRFAAVEHQSRVEKQKKMIATEYSVM